MSHIRVKVFSVLRSTLNASEMTVEVNSPIRAGALMDAACAQYPKAAPFRDVMRLAVNLAYVDEDASVEVNDEVAMVTAGQWWVSVQTTY